ncbi:MAG: hypothetical protein K0R59_3246 [Sphingobacterium sp.]|jgi:hypothetical protein|nr:hypothetical protein [Sphingobacterium sp.]
MAVSYSGVDFEVIVAAVWKTRLMGEEPGYA